MTCRVDYAPARNSVTDIEIKTSMAKKKNAAAVQLAKQRMRSLSAAKRKEIAASGGRAAWKDVSAPERSRIMRERRNQKRA